MVSMIDMVKILCGVGGFILIIFLIIMVSNAISTLKRLNAVLDDLLQDMQDKPATIAITASARNCFMDSFYLKLKSFILPYSV